VTARNVKIDRRYFPAYFKFNIQYSFEPGYLDKFIPWKDYINRFYLPFPPDLMGSGRPWFYGSPDEYRERLPGIISEILDKGFQPEIICNDPFPDLSGSAEIVRYMKLLADNGLRHATVAFLPLGVLFRREFPSLELTASTIAFIHDAARLDRWVELAGVTAVIPDRSCNKKLGELKALRRSGLSVGLVVDDGCLPSCPIQFQHYSVNAADGRNCANALEHLKAHGDYEKFILDNCHKFERDLSWRFYQSDLVPANLPAYAGIVSTIKFTRLVGMNRAEILLDKMFHFLDASNGCNFSLGYYEPEDVLPAIQECDRVCRKCLWCRDVFHKWNVSTELAEKTAGVLWTPRSREKMSAYLANYLPR